MNKIYAYIDEFGAYGFDFSKPGNSNLFIIAAVIVKESEIDTMNLALEQIRKEEFSGSEIKSGHIKGNNIRRVRILNKVLKLPFSLLVLVVDKKEIFPNHGVTKNKKYFYEFINNLLYKELRGSYSNLHIVTDEVGQHEFADEFTKFVKSHRSPLTLFDTEEFSIVDSKKSNVVQLADLIAGTLSYVYEPNKRVKVPSGIDYLKIIDKKISKITFFPKSYDENLFEYIEGNNDYCKDIAMTAYRLAQKYENEHEKSSDEDVKRSLFVLRYLMFRFKYNNLRRYISTKELLNALERHSYGRMSEQTFRSKIIGRLRDGGVIISSSSKGYKLPSSEKEIIDYYAHVNSMIIPMLYRLNLCNDSLRLASTNTKDYLDAAQFVGLKAIAEKFKESNHTL